MMRNFKFLFILLLVMLHVSCSSALADEHETNTTIDNPISPWEMQSLLGRGFDVQWAEFNKKIEAYGVDEVKAIKEKGFNTARIRTALPADDYLFAILDQCISDCLANGIIPVLAYNAQNYEAAPNEETLNESLEWWDKIAKHFCNASHRLIFNLNIEWSDIAGKSQQAIDTFNEKATSVIRKSNPTRILIYSPAKLSNPEYLYQMAIPKEAGKYVIAEWHLYASGPSKNPKSSKYWSSGTDAEKKNITDKIAKGKEWQEYNNIPTWVGAWMPGNYNKGNDFTIEEQCDFAKFMVSSLKEANIPWAVNSLDKYYDVSNDCWFPEMLPLVDILSK